MKKSANKTIISGVLAAAVLVGGAGLVHNQVFAAASDTSTSVTENSNQPRAGGQSQGQGGFRGDFGKRGGGLEGVGRVDLLKQTATILGAEETAVSTQLEQGLTWVQIAAAAGLTEEDYLAKLVAAQTAAISEAVTAGKLTQEQADKLTSSLSEQLKKQIERTNVKQKDTAGTNADANGQKNGKGTRADHGLKGGFASNADLAAILGITEEELGTLQQEGKSLAEIAESKGITSDELIAKIKDSLTDELKTFIDRKGNERPAGGKIKAPAAAPATQTEASVESAS
ncbi:MAG: hypothetical protein K0Q90_2633 [Paenibacillaceae bacterium]|nr:hypothetical protein [Paenibacillaceae bacterium]